MVPAESRRAGVAEISQDGRSQRARQRRLERRQQILEAAVRVFASRGFHATGVSDIVEAAAVARGTFYLYFPSKLAVFEELLDQVTRAVEEAITRVEVGPGAPPALDQLRANVRRLLLLPRARPELLRLLLRQAVGLDPELDHKLEAFHQRMFALTERSLRTGMASGLVRPLDPVVTARCVVGGLKELLLSLIEREDLPTADLEQLGEELLAFNAWGLLRPELGEPLPG